MTIKSADGRGIIVVNRFSVAAGGVTALLAAPGVGFRHQLLALASTATGGALQLRDVGTAAVRYEWSNIAATRALQETLADGLAFFGDNEAVEANNTSATAIILTITTVVEPSI